MATLLKTRGLKRPSIVKDLIPGYTLETDCVDRDAWYSCTRLFDDASLFQTWSYGSISWGEENISHLVLKKGKKVVAAAQSRISALPQVGAGIAYIRWGPMWRLKGTEPEAHVFQSMLHALKHEYANRRGLIVRIIPHINHGLHPLVPFKYYLERFSLGSSPGPYRTLIVNIRMSEEMLRKGMTHRARNHLVRAEKRDFEVIQGTADDLFGMFVELYEQTIGRKRFASSISLENYRVIQKDLPNDHKMQIMICMYEGKPCSALICSPMGDMGINLLSANSNLVIESNLGSSYLLFWKMALWLKGNNYALYDLGGIDPFDSPGTYRFKKNFAGSNGNPSWNIGQFDCWNNLLLYTGVRFIDVLGSAYADTKKALMKRKSPREAYPTS